MMRKLIIILLFFFIKCPCFAQTEAGLFKQKQLNNKALNQQELKSLFAKFDLSKLWTTTSTEVVFGFIGDDYQRIRIKLITVKKQEGANEYHVYGKSLVKANICNFEGAINIKNIRKFKVTSYGLDDNLKGKGIKGQYIILGEYKFLETKTQPHSGIFSGVFETQFYVDKNNRIHYDNIDLNADGYTNNQFVGTWNSNTNNLSKRCNWGDYRIPNSGDLDIGAGEFSPADKYLKNGWQPVRYRDGGIATSAKATKAEQASWWK